MFERSEVLVSVRMMMMMMMMMIMMMLWVVPLSRFETAHHL
jgi:hypothetical protein